MRRPGGGKLARFESCCCAFQKEGPDSILSAFSSEPLPAKLQDN